MTDRRTLSLALSLLAGTSVFSAAQKPAGGGDSSPGTAQSRPSSSQDPRIAFESAQRALSAGDYKRAESGFREVLKLDPKSAAAYVNLGVVYMRTEKFDAAIKALQSAKGTHTSCPTVVDPATAGVCLRSQCLGSAELGPAASWSRPAPSLPLRGGRP